TDADDSASLTLAAGVHTFAAHSPDASEPAQLCAAVPPAGRTLTLVLARLAARHGVDVRIDAPADFDGKLALHAWSDALPRIEGGEDVTAEAVARDLAVTRIDERHYRVAADALPWHLAGSSIAFELDQVEVAADQETVVVRLRRTPPAPLCRLRCRVLDQD